jgi:hypothetical protein|tara:strand:- start:14121 stop:14360 length:240 start_codon:yes stop_codon:yes gene_type:complete
MKKFFYTAILCSTVFLFSCEYKEVNEDAKTYCDCKTRQYEGKTEPGECPKMLGALKEKYEYLPEQYEILANRIAECIAE